jgi:hypothetical protein
MQQNNARIATLWLIGTALIAVGSQGVAPPALEGKPAPASPRVTLLRVPDHGIQPQVAVDAKGIVHLIYFKGDPYGGDIFYVRSKDGRAFSRPLRVNSQPGSAIAVGNIRGAHLALGKNSRVHVAWNGSNKGEPKGSVKPAPMLYTRMNDAGTAFEPQRNVIRSAFGLDGGGSVAADGNGNVYVAWHAPEPDSRGEDRRRVWVAVSTDDGKTFACEKTAWTKPTGVCGCCGLRAFADPKGMLYVLYRSAARQVHRDMYLLISRDKGSDFEGIHLHPWQVETCPMSTASFTQGRTGILAAWETKGQVYFARIDRTTGKCSTPVPAPGTGSGRKHAAVAVNARGELLLVWTEGMGWNRGGSLAWQVFDRSGEATKDKGGAESVPTWSLVAAFVRPDGGFTVVY